MRPFLATLSLLATTALFALNPAPVHAAPPAPQLGSTSITVTVDRTSNF
jgi:hypothetical protein